MTGRPLCYVAGPYWDQSPKVRAWNVARAAFLGRLAVLEGLAPIVVHTSIQALYGTEETMANRAVGLEVDLSILRLVARGSDAGRGWLWGLYRDDRTLSEGTRLEVTEWKSLRAEFGAHTPLLGDWREWGLKASKHGMADVWKVLAVQP